MKDLFQHATQCLVAITGSICKKKKFAGGAGGTLMQIKGGGDKCDMRGKARQRQLNTDK